MSKKAKKINAMESLAVPSVLPVMYLDPLTKAEQDQRRSSKQRSRKLLAHEARTSRRGAAAPAAPPPGLEHLNMHRGETIPDYLERLNQERTNLDKGDTDLPKVRFLKTRSNDVDEFLKDRQINVDESRRKELKEFCDNVQEGIKGQRSDWVPSRPDDKTFEAWKKDLNDEIELEKKKLDDPDQERIERLNGKLAELFARQEWGDDYLIAEKKERERMRRAMRGDGEDDNDGARTDNHQNTSSAGMGKRMGVNQFLLLVLFVLYVHLF